MQEVRMSGLQAVVACTRLRHVVPQGGAQKSHMRRLGPAFGDLGEPAPRAYSKDEGTDGGKRSAWEGENACGARSQNACGAGRATCSPLARGMSGELATLLSGLRTVPVFTGETGAVYGRPSRPVPSQLLNFQIDGRARAAKLPYIPAVNGGSVGKVLIGYLMIPAPADRDMKQASKSFLAANSRGSKSRRKILMRAVNRTRIGALGLGVGNRVQRLGAQMPVEQNLHADGMAWNGMGGERRFSILPASVTGILFNNVSVIIIGDTPMGRPRGSNARFRVSVTDRVMVRKWRLCASGARAEAEAEAEAYRSERKARRAFTPSFDSPAVRKSRSLDFASAGGEVGVHETPVTSGRERKVLDGMCYMRYEKNVDRQSCRCAWPWRGEPSAASANASGAEVQCGRHGVEWVEREEG
ncbi:hypothetical protein DFH09DRAFT_1467449 [Mycena vulgaris]|nr:hypothetical protein DFH09DRAFT_1467449 [Mycena vulgaris]